MAIAARATKTVRFDLLFPHGLDPERTSRPTRTPFGVIPAERPVKPVMALQHD